MAQALELLLNECMEVERQQALGVGPHQRGEDRHGQANGFQPKQMKTRVGPLNLRVPQVLSMRSSTCPSTRVARRFPSRVANSAHEQAATASGS